MCSFSVRGLWDQRAYVITSIEHQTTFGQIFGVIISNPFVLDEINNQIK